MNESYKFHQVGDIEKPLNGDTKKVVFENAMYRVVKNNTVRKTWGCIV